MSRTPTRIVIHQGASINPIELTSLAPFSDAIATVGVAGEQALYDWFLPVHRPPVDDVTIDADGSIHLHMFDPSGASLLRRAAGADRITGNDRLPSDEPEMSDALTKPVWAWARLPSICPPTLETIDKVGPLAIAWQEESGCWAWLVRELTLDQVISGVAPTSQEAQSAAEMAMRSCRRRAG
jgi:hypothetical protein